MQLFKQDPFNDECDLNLWAVLEDTARTLKLRPEFVDRSRPLLVGWAGRAAQVLRIQDASVLHKLREFGCTLA